MPASRLWVTLHSEDKRNDNKNNSIKITNIIYIYIYTYLFTFIKEFFFQMGGSYSINGAIKIRKNCIYIYIYI